MCKFVFGSPKIVWHWLQQWKEKDRSASYGKEKHNKKNNKSKQNKWLEEEEKGLGMRLWRKQWKWLRSSEQWNDGDELLGVRLISRGQMVQQIQK